MKIHEYEGGLLHITSLTMDGDMTLIESANMDRRSFELNDENNILLCDETTTRSVIERQTTYLRHSNEVTLQSVQAWSVPTRLWNNTLAMLGPVL